MDKVSFTVDAGIINRLGLELVSKSETALSELIKNAYDADANTVALRFTASHQEGGTLEIEDDGEGMDKYKLVKSFLRLATSDKIHNAVSKKHQRPKAGRKGIGRFSAQRLGTKLTIITQTANSDTALRLSIDWDSYETDREIQDIKNDLDEIPRLPKTQGTILVIEHLREKWSEADIKRVYRYVADLIQPDFLKQDAAGNIVTESKKEAFEVFFSYRSAVEKEYNSIADAQTMLLDKALAIFTGYVDTEGNGRINIESRTFRIEERKEALKKNIDIANYNLLKNTNILFKIYYYIGGDRNTYYGITKPELNVIIDYLEKEGGVRLYRNGFVVSKYGTKNNDWLNIAANGSKLRLGLPLNNNRVLGFVQVIDAEGKIFEEAAGREGLIETAAFGEMQTFLSNSIEMAFKEFASWFRRTDEYKKANPDKKATAPTSTIKQLVDDIKTATDILNDPNASEQEKNEAAIKIEQATKKLAAETQAAINELEMLRVLAGVGLTIAEFVHEIKQFVPSLNGYIHFLQSKKLGIDIDENLQKMREVLNSFLSYTAYFDATISQNVVRELRPIDLRTVTNHFKTSIQPDLERRHITLDIDFRGYDLITCPMHPSEWNTILQNLYSNAKKAMRRLGVKYPKIRIEGFKDKEKGLVYLNFYDNGIGISKENQTRIFDAFFSTSPPNKHNSITEDTGTGLGLYIIKQIIKNRNGEISVGQPIDDYKTCIAIQLPLVTSKQLQQYGY